MLARLASTLASLRLRRVLLRLAMELPGIRSGTLSFSRIDSIQCRYARFCFVSAQRNCSNQRCRSCRRGNCDIYGLIDRRFYGWGYSYPFRRGLGRWFWTCFHHSHSNICCNTTSMVLTYVSGGPWVAGTYTAQTGTLTQTGGTSVSVNYAVAYTSTPTVVVTPTSNAGALYISASSQHGFHHHVCDERDANFFISRYGKSHEVNRDRAGQRFGVLLLLIEHRMLALLRARSDVL